MTSPIVNLAAIVAEMREMAQRGEHAHILTLNGWADRLAALASHLQGQEQEAQTRFAWLLERSLDGAPAYWDGGHAESFTRDANQAIQFARKYDALWCCRDGGRGTFGWRIIEHGFMNNPLAETIVVSHLQEKEKEKENADQARGRTPADS